MATAWGVVRVAPNSGERAARNLSQQQFEIYNPRYQTRNKQTIVSLFPGYLFVDISERWRSINSTFGVLQLLMADVAREVPSTIHQSCIDGLRECEVDGLVDLKRWAVNVAEEFKAGSSVMFTEHSSFAYQLGKFVGDRARERVAILFHWLGAQRIIEVDRGDIVAA